MFNNKYPDANLTEDFLANEIPMRIKDLEAKGNYFKENLEILIFCMRK